MTKRKLLYIFGGIAAAAALIIYLVLMFQRGVWYDNYFLRKTNENEYCGRVDGITMTLTRTSSEDGIHLDFTRGNKSLHYIIYNDADAPENNSLKIYENNELIFTGYYQKMQDWYLIFDSSGEYENLSVTVTGITDSYYYDTYELQPSKNELVFLALDPEFETFRGSFAVMPFILILAGILALDIAFPRLFFYLKHMLAVENPEPSYFYYFMQKIGRVILLLVIIVMAWIALYR